MGRLRPPTWLGLVAFDVRIGGPRALSVLRRRLGRGGLVRFAPHFLRASLRRLPAPAPDWPVVQERLVRRQFRSAWALDAALLARGMAEGARRELVTEVVAEVGAAFIAHNLPLPDPDRWFASSGEDRHAFVQSCLPRLFNARVEVGEVGEQTLAFDVTRCRFTELAAEVGAPDLARAFCAADTRFAAGEVPIELRRAGTLATGADRCDFRFTYRAS